MAPQPQQLAGIALAALGVALAIVAVSTRGWVVHTGTDERGSRLKTELGLFKVCAYANDEELLCQKLVDPNLNDRTCDSDRTVSDINAYVRAMQAMCIIAILVGVAAVMTGGAKASGQIAITAPVDGALSFVAAAVSVITFVLFAVFYGTWVRCGSSMCHDMCRNLTDCTCGLNYSFGLCVVAFVSFVVGGATMVLAGVKQHSVAGRLLPGSNYGSGV